ncbi:YeeE/YedE family protein [Aquirhabdus parva]|uniref:YeeE/YedE family protein n=1 Tax=Aquirhabdus parva TaxID=2283318 RepID=A0A345P6P0_9GAMM|nr:YeeE/YedE family protein [Aquirhabdus parva]AXI02949.1 YeeE/YedE family protein [Aquirhabdus parva]
MSLQQFAPQVLGGALIGLGAAVLLLFNGQIAGISGIYGRLIRADFGARHWRLAFLIGLLIPATYLLLQHTTPIKTVSVGILALAGLLVGLGTGISNGCTSGHGVCGIANLSPRSLIATLLFMASAIVTVFVIRHVI